MVRRSRNQDGHEITAADEAAVTRAVANCAQFQALDMCVDIDTASPDESWRECELVVDGKTVTVLVVEIVGQGALFSECEYGPDLSLFYRFFAGRYEGVWSFSSRITIAGDDLAGHNKAARTAAEFIFSSDR